MGHPQDQGWGGVGKKNQEKSRSLAPLGMTNYLGLGEMGRSGAAPLQREEKPKSTVRSDCATRETQEPTPRGGVGHYKSPRRPLQKAAATKAGETQDPGKKSNLGHP